jgi:hypothetical protein
MVPHNYILQLGWGIDGLLLRPSQNPGPYNFSIMSHYTSRYFVGLF